MGKGLVKPETFFKKVRKEIVQKNKRLNIFISIPKKFDVKTKGKLGGLPVSVKDCVCTKGLQSTAGSKILEGYVPPFDATVVKRIKKEGGVIIGKTAQDEFGFGTFSTNCAYGTPKNPIDPSRSAGGSSGGSAVAVASLSFPHISIAESTGGSISCPASFCGVYGITPTYGLVSRYGLIDYSNSLDKIGVMGKNAWDCALGLSVIAGKDGLDQTCVGETKNYTTFKRVKDKVVGVPKEYFSSAVSESVQKNVWDAIKFFESEGATIKKVSLPNTHLALPAYYIIAMTESSTNLAKLCGMRYGLSLPIEGSFNEYFSKVRTKGFGEEAKRRILLGTYMRMKGYRNKYYLKAMKIRTLVINDFKKAFKTCDVLAAPTMPFIAPKFSEIRKLTPTQVYAADVLTVAPNLAGIPMMNVPCGTHKGMPIGLHLMADHFQEEKILGFAGVKAWRR
ncbi:MAG: Asp-tRNA(Asn)/Glu-tRNA(Gln) amidotransferase subunit GatA [Nanoarchaeota archaeon]|nr:Asp-tRNA(Asn)/Glu-tRNA(Gln) amidotransferase subunit GatA [Nanoarchaeota archaeon]